MSTMTELNGKPAEDKAASQTVILENRAADLAENFQAEQPPRRIGEFTLIREVGRGGMGVVYEAFQESLHRTVALKILPLAGRINQRQIRRFQNESMAAAQLQHPNIIPVYSVGNDAGVHYYAMQLIEGKDLAQIIRFARNVVDSKVARPSGDTPRYMGTTAPVPAGIPHKRDASPSSDTASRVASDVDSMQFSRLIESLAVRKSFAAAPSAFEPLIEIGVQAADALQHAHDLGIVHRDIKPSNLLLDDHGKLWVADFGLAQVQGAAAMTMTGEVVGTLRYMSPEQPLGNHVLVDQRTDIYSLGITLYELLTLKKAFTGATPKEIIKQVCFDEPISVRRLNPMVPLDLETIILKAISKNPADRYQSAAEFADDLRRFRDDRPILARRPALVQRCRRWIRRHVLFATSVAVAIVALLLTSITASAVIWNSLIAETQQRKRAESLLNKSEGLRLAANSGQQVESNPGLAMLLAIRGRELTSSVDAGSALLHALRKNHELRTFSPHEQITDRFDISPDGSRVVSTSTGKYSETGSSPAIVSDLTSGETLLTLESDSDMTSAAYSPDGRFILTTSVSRKQAESATESAIPTFVAPELRDALTGTRRFVFNDALLENASRLCFSPASDLVALFGPDHSVRLCSTLDGHVTAAFDRHSARILSAVFSPDGKRVVSVSEDKTVRVWDSATAAEIRVFTRETEQPQRLVADFVGDSETVMVSDDTGTSLMSVESGERINEQHWQESKAVVSHTGSLIALMHPFGEKVTIRGRHSGQVISELISESPVTSATFSPDGKMLLTTTFTNARIYQTDDGTPVASLNGQTEFVSRGAFTPDGTRVVTTSEDGTVRLWSVKSGEDRMTFAVRPTEQAPYPFTVSDDSALIAAATAPTYRGELREIDGNVGANQFLGRIASPQCDTERLVTVTTHNVYVWHFPTFRQIASISFDEKTVRSAVAVPNSSLVVVLIEGGPTYLWNTDNNETQLVVDPYVSALDCEAHPSDGRIALSLKDGRCVLINSGSGQVEQNLRHEGQVLSVKFSSDGGQLLTVDDRNTAHLWRGREFADVLSIQSPGLRFDRAVFSSDDSAIITWSARQKEAICAWDAQGGVKLGETSAIGNARVTLHETRPVAAVSSEAGVFLWDWTNSKQQPLTNAAGKCAVFLGDRLLSIEHAENEPAEKVPATDPRQPEFAPWMLNVRDITTEQLLSSSLLTAEPWNLSADSKTQQVVLSFRTHDVTVMDMKTHETVASVGRHAAPVIFQAFGPENRTVVCVSIDRTASIWNTTGQRLHVLVGHQSEILSAALSPDRRQLVTFDATGHGIQWNVQDGAQVREFDGHSGPVLTATFAASGRQLMTAGTDKTIRLWDLVGRTVSEFQFEQSVLCAELSADERQILVIEGQDAASLKTATVQGLPPRNSRTVLLQAESGLRSFPAMEGWPQLGRIRPDGKQFAILMRDDNVHVYDIATGKLNTKFNPNRRLVHDLAFSPDSLELLVMHSDELSLWELESGTERLRIPNQGQFRIPAASTSAYPEWTPFSPDGRWIITSTNRIKKWPRNPLKEALQQTPRAISKDEIRQFSLNPVSEE